jgi:hypothetical protein
MGHGLILLWQIIKKAGHQGNWLLIKQVVIETGYQRNRPSCHRGNRPSRDRLSGEQDIRVTGHQRNRPSVHKVNRTSGKQEIKETGHQEDRTSRGQDIKRTGHQEDRTSRKQDIKEQNIKRTGHQGNSHGEQAVTKTNRGIAI